MSSTLNSEEKTAKAMQEMDETGFAFDQPSEELTEEQIIEQTPDSEHSPADVAAAFFSMNQKKLFYALQTMSVKQLRRIIMHTAAWPLSDVFTPKTDVEKSAAYLFNEMVFNRSIMMLQLEAEKVENAQKEELEKIRNKGEQNG